MYSFTTRGATQSLYFCWVLGTHSWSVANLEIYFYGAIRVRIVQKPLGNKQTGNAHLKYNKTKMRLFMIQSSRRLLLSSILLRQVSALATMSTKVIDSHLHVWAPSSKSNEYPYASGQTPPNSLINKASAEDLLSCMSDSGVDGALIGGIYISLYLSR